VSFHVLASLLIGLVRPQSVVDVGCGVGNLLKAFADQGVTDLLGIDGPWVPRDLLSVPASVVETHDLSRAYRPSRRFDLVVSTEVGEHLPGEAAEMFVDTLTGLGPVVAFGAAIPLQGGTHHVNEQWPAYWAKLFRARGYLVLDCLRPRLIGDPRVAELIGQNMVLYIHSDRAADLMPAITAAMHEWPDYPLPVVHPRQYLRMQDYIANAPSRLGLVKTLKALPGLVVQGVSARFGRSRPPAPTP